MPPLGPIVPSILLTVAALAVLLADLVAKGRRPVVPSVIAVAGLVAAALVAWSQTPSSTVVFGGLRADSFGLAMTVFCCAVGVLTVFATLRGETFRAPGGEYLLLILAAVLGMVVLSMSVDFVVLYLAFETVSIPAYVLVGMRRSDLGANEASMKYVLFGAVCSATMLYGISLLAGLAGSTSLDALSVAITNGAAGQPIFWVACLLVSVGFAFKISAVPAHFWAPDVYAGAPTAVGGFLAVASKAAGFAALIRVVAAVVPGEVAQASGAGWLPEGPFLLQVVGVLAILSMTLGNAAALRQTEIKRLLAWSSIAHAGYLLMAIAVWGPATLAGLVFYLVAYLFTNLAAFALAGMIIRRQGSGELSAFRGLARRNIGLALAMAIVMFSLTGLPPFFGFVGKLQVFYGVFEKGYAALGILGLLNGVVSLTYYMRVVASMFPFSDESNEPVPAWKLPLADKVLSFGLVAPVLVFGIFWSPLWEWAKRVTATVIGTGG